MTGGFHCPVEGCSKHHDEWEGDDPPFDAFESLQGHVNAMSDEAHKQAREKGVLTDLQAEIDEEDADNPPDDGGNYPSKEGNEAPDGDTDDYEEQWASATEGGELGDGDEDDGPDDGDDDGSDTPSNGGLPTSWKLVGGVVIALIVVVLVVRARSEDGETDDYETDEEPASEPDETGDVTAHDLISEDHG